MYIFFFFLRMCCISYCHGAAVGRGGRGGGGGSGCSHLGQTTNPPRSSESWKGCHVMHLVIQQSVVNQTNYCRCASHGLSLSFVDCWGSVSDLVLFDRDAKMCSFCSTPMTLSPNFNKTLYEVCCIWGTHTWIQCYLGTLA